jgi:pyruvate/2-oxoglutarate dehydrogenase complex dihydrolipoamide acyltransferase (E2) component
LTAQLTVAKATAEKERLTSELEVTSAKVTEVSAAVAKLETRIAGAAAQGTEWAATYKTSLTGLTAKFKEVKTAEAAATCEVAEAVQQMPLAPAEPASLPPLAEENPPALRKAVRSLAKEFGLTENKPFRVVTSLPSGRVLSAPDGKTVAIQTKEAGKDAQLWCFDPETKTIRSRAHPTKSLDITGAGK